MWEYYPEEEESGKEPSKAFLVDEIRCLVEIRLIYEFYSL